MKIAVKKSDTSEYLSLPNDLIEQYHFENEVELELMANGVFIKSSETPRGGWKEAFKSEIPDEEIDWTNIGLTQESDDSEWTW